VNVKFAFIRSEEGHYPIDGMCRWARVSRSGYYKWRDRAPSLTAARRAVLTELVLKSFHDSDGTYGYRRVHADLADWGWPCHVETVRSIMRELNLVACQPRPYKVTTRPGADPVPAPDHVQRDFTATEPGAKLVGDITYIRTWAGWVYLATVIDCCTKMIIGYALADHMRTTLVTDALNMALRAGRAGPGSIFHSDRGAQYTSGEFAAYCAAVGITRSMGRTGTCYDNALAESVNAAIKNERVNRTVYPTREHAIRDVTSYIELRYNRRRRHSALGYLTPLQAETSHYTTKSA
jgi:transposase InsO family protein